MNLLKILGLQKDNKPASRSNDKPAQDNQKPEHPAHGGGCCGSCGGQGHH